MKPKQFAEILSFWYGRQKRNLPWRGIRNPYIIWVSEIILQQTRVEQGLPYYERFIAAFPDVNTLASAPLDKVLKAWEGLGYYSRARNLHAAARQVSERLGGVFPTSYDGLLALPGIGPYTAAAIASICYDERVPVIDGNVNRFISRMIALEVAVDTAFGRKAIHDTLMPAIQFADSPGDFNQGLMEFGAQHCIPRNPDCSTCTFHSGCAATQLDLVKELPYKKAKAKVRDRFFTYHVLLHNGNTYVRQRKEKGIWQGLFEFIPEEKTRADTLGHSIIDGKVLHPQLQKNYTHLLSHQRIHARFVVYVLAEKPTIDDVRELPLSQLSELALARITTRFLEENGEEIQAIAGG